MREPGRFAERLVVVTGAASGIGRATSLAFARQGARIAALDVDGTGAEEVAAECARLSGSAATAHEVDVADREAMSRVAKAVVDEHGAPEVLVNNAGVGLSGTFLDTPLDDWDWIVSINLMGVVHGCHAFGEAMLEAGRGHVVNMSSGLGYVATPDQPAYCATKAAVLSLSRSLRADWRPRGVSVSALCPGITDTPIVERARFRGEGADDERDRARRLFRRRRYGPERVGRAVVDTVRRDRPVVPVSPESWFGWVLNRVLPARAGDLLARLRARSR